MPNNNLYSNSSEAETIWIQVEIPMVALTIYAAIRYSHVDEMRKSIVPAGIQFRKYCVNCI